MIDYRAKTTSEYICQKDKTHREISASGQKKICWKCNSKMDEKVNTVHGMVIK